jgi:hypothetical protein
MSELACETVHIAISIVAPRAETACLRVSLPRQERRLVRNAIQRVSVANRLWLSTDRGPAAPRGLGSVAPELAPVRVNAVSPGLIATPLWAGMADDKREAMFAGAAHACRRAVSVNRKISPMPETANGSFGGLAQESFEVGEGQFGWVEVRRVLRQVEKRRARGRWLHAPRRQNGL